MRIYWSLPLPGPFRIGGTLWRSKRRRRYPVLDCGHAHRTRQAYERCPYRPR